jgi:PQQ-dependent catabolism-associated CXXCW motif protein
MMTITSRHLIFVLALLAPAHGLAQDTPEPEGYRTENYRAPTPATLKGARVVTTPVAQQIWNDGGAVFLDVLPRAPRPANLPAGTIWRDKPRLNIPGSVWLPDTGYGALAPVMENYLRSNVTRITGGDRAKMLVVYCQRACWMSWNAAKRILAMGYTNLAWYPDGTDGWEEAGLALQESKPEPQSVQ